MAYSPVPTASSSIKAWWASAVVYQVYPRSFADANGDGMGDLRGVTAHLDHLHKLGVDAVWLSPFYKSPQADAGYDVADYREVDPLFGTLADFDEMLQKAHGLGLKVIVDLVPNHTSDEHAWFQEALAAAPGSRERDRYMFRPGKDSVPGSGDGDLAPNNWKSIFGGPAWSRVTEADGAPGEWYLHLFDTKQPDLNWENAEVKEEMRSVLRFWLDRGVDGFRVDVAHGMVKEAGLPDWEGSAAMVEGATELPGDAHGGHTEAEEPHRAHAAAAGGAAPAGAAVTASTTGEDDGHQPVSPLYPPSPFFDQDGVHDIYRDWNRVLAEYDGDRMLVAEAWVEPAERLARYVRPDEMQQAFNFDFLLAGWDAARTAVAIEASLRAAATVGATTTWVLSNHDTVRHSTRFGLKDPTTFPKGIAAEDEQPDAGLGLARARAATMVSLALPGSAYLYQGEELGLPEHTAVPAEARQDPTFFRTNGVERGRDGCRVPLPWKSGEPGYGFASAAGTQAGAGTGAANAPAAPWLPQPESFGVLAADRQDGVAGSTLEMYRAALAFRREHRLGAGSFVWADSHEPAGGVLAFRNGDVLVVANMGIAAAPLPNGYRVALASMPEAVTGGDAEAKTDLAGPRKLAPNSAVYLLAD